ncbi:hypothetical protein V6N11_038056 [Hibiscus sabdariffa]|uniref:Endonuclease/exonuclease/phosphatase domain-containing protein n=1 Tax=Hibiscus sabdariffa TaxID=183260 RepID=A0ABR1ZX93_9ROSI
MRFVIWNVRGLGTDLKLNAVKKLVREQQVQVLLLQETKKTAISEDEVRKLWVDEFDFRVGNAVGRSGGVEGDFEGWWNNPLERVGLSKDKAYGKAQLLKGVAKFSVVGVSNAVSAGCGGVLSLGGGEIRALFAGLLQRSDVTNLDLSTIKMALEIFIEAGFADQFKLHIETPLMVAVNWLQNPLQRPWSKWLMLAEFDKLIYKTTKVHFEVLDNLSSSMAIWLARDGASRNELFKAWL